MKYSVITNVSVITNAESCNFAQLQFKFKAFVCQFCCVIPKENNISIPACILLLCFAFCRTKHNLVYTSRDHVPCEAKQVGSWSTAAQQHLCCSSSSGSEALDRRSHFCLHSSCFSLRKKKIKPNKSPSERFLTLPAPPMQSCIVAAALTECVSFISGSRRLCPSWLPLRAALPGQRAATAQCL